MNPLIRVTTLEAFRKYIEQSDYANYEITEQSVIDSIVGEFKGNEYTRIGTAFHRIVEEHHNVRKLSLESVHFYITIRNRKSRLHVVGRLTLTDIR